MMLKRGMGKIRRRDRVVKWREFELIMRVVSERTLLKLGWIWADMVTAELRRETERARESMKRVVWIGS